MEIAITVAAAIVTEKETAIAKTIEMALQLRRTACAFSNTVVTV